MRFCLRAFALLVFRAQISVFFVFRARTFLGARVCVKARTGKPGQDRQNRQAKQDRQHGTGRMGQTKQDMQNGTDRRGQTEQDRQNGYEA